VLQAAVLQNVKQYSFVCGASFVFVMALNIEVLALWAVTWRLLVTTYQTVRCHVAERSHLTISPVTKIIPRNWTKHLYIKLPLN
jgi:hypothetical protein